MPGSHRQAPYGFLLSRRWLGWFALAALAAAVCVLLGNWQWDRMGQRHERNNLIRSNVGAAPVAADTLLRVGSAPRDGAEYARVRVTGSYDVARQLLVRLRPFEGQVGYHVLTPLVAEDGRALLVDRGWVPAGDVGSGLPEVPDPPRGRVTVTARVRPSEPASTTGTPPAGQVTRIDVPGIAATLPYEVYGGYGELTREDPTLRTAPTQIPPPEPSEGPHLAYAFQWYLFAALGFGGLVVLARREAADRRAADDSPTPGPAESPRVRATRSVRE